MQSTDSPPTEPKASYTLAREAFCRLSSGDAGQTRLFHMIVAQQRQIDALTARLYGPADANGGDDGDVEVLRRDVAELTETVGWVRSRAHAAKDEDTVELRQRIAHPEGRVEAGEAAMRRADLAAAGAFLDGFTETGGR